FKEKHLNRPVLESPSLRDRPEDVPEDLQPSRVLGFVDPVIVVVKKTQVGEDGESVQERSQTYERNASVSLQPHRNWF
ncbi:MAG: hypothetical protein VX910_11840, partial [Candidatus Latescibacterota bacterium]|nr:hypothetical protein [Candidatus Latescibacterota bacterium]